MSTTEHMPWEDDRAAYMLVPHDAAERAEF